MQYSIQEDVAQALRVSPAMAKAHASLKQSEVGFFLEEMHKKSKINHNNNHNNNKCLRTQLDTEGESSYPLLCPTAVPLAKTHRVTEGGRSGEMIVSLFMDGQLMNTHKLKK